MRTNEDHEVLCLMAQIGGNFVKKLAELGFSADENNLRRLKSSWPELWETYRAVLTDEQKDVDRSTYIISLHTADHPPSPRHGRAAEFRRVTAPAWAEYEQVKVKAQAWAELVTAQALAEFMRITAPERAEFELVKARGD